MKKYLTIFALLIFIAQPANAWDAGFPFLKQDDKKAVQKVLKSQVKYANNANYKKFIETYDPQYQNSDGFNLDTYISLVKEIWNTYHKIKYDIVIQDISIDENTAKVKLKETAFAKISVSEPYDGELKSTADTIYTLNKKDGKWKVVSDSVIDETTTMLYGDAKDLDIKLTVPNKIEANTEYCATLEFTPPAETIAIASIASDLVEYPQKPTKEVFRAMPEDNILERLFTSNNQNKNEYIVASIGLTKTSICDLNIKLSLTGFGYKIKRVNVIKDDSKNLKEGINNSEKILIEDKKDLNG